MCFRRIITIKKKTTSLQEHIKRQPSATYFRKDPGRETINLIYKLIERAINDQADTLEFNKVGWLWSRNAIIIYKTNFGLGFPEEGILPLWQANKRAIHKILAGDPIAAQYIQLVKETEDEIILKFVDPAAKNSESEETNIETQ